MQIHELRDEAGNVIHACATASFPLPTDHWIYAEPVQPPAIGDTQSELAHELRLKVRDAMKYTIQVCTSRGKDTDFDPDAMWMTLEHTLFERRMSGRPFDRGVLDMESKTDVDCAPILLPPICWVSRPESVPELVRGIDEGFDYCPECVKVVAQEYRDKYPQYADDIIEDGGCEPLWFSDSPASCGRCNCMLSCSIEVDGEQICIETESDWYAAT